MAVSDFPSLAPSARSWTPGRRPVQAFSSQSGYEVRALFGNRPVGQQLSLSFANISDATGELITAHFEEALGVYEVFDLPAAVFAGMAGFAHVKPSGNQWRYAKAPDVTYVAPGVQSVSVELVAVA